MMSDAELFGISSKVLGIGGDVQFYGPAVRFRLFEQTNDLPLSLH